MVPSYAAWDHCPERGRETTGYMEGSQHRVALIAVDSSAELRPIRKIVQEELSGWDIREFDHLGELTEAAGEFSPDIAIVCQRWRDQFVPADIASALGHFPLARWICVYGAWCESEGRHGSRWPLAVRIPIWSFRTRLLGEIAIVDGQRPVLPITADREEIFESDVLTEFPEFQPGNATATAISPDPGIRAWLKDVLEESGFETTGKSPDKNPDLVVIDLDPITGNSCRRLESLRQDQPTARIVVLRDSVEACRDPEIQNAGADVILAKLAPTAELTFALQITDAAQH